MSQTKIEVLTDEQERQLVEWRSYWLAVGRSTAPADRPTAEYAIRKMYSWIGEPEPKFWWCDGPAVGSMIRTILGSNLDSNLWSNLGSNLLSNLWSNLRSNLGSNLGCNLWSNLESNLRSNLGRNLGRNLGSNLLSNLESNLGSNLGSNLWSNLESNLRSNLGRNLGSNLRSNLGSNLLSNLGWYFWGQHECYWQAFLEFPHCFLRPMHTLEQEEKLQAWLSISKSCGWWTAFKGIVFVCERPSVQAVDSEGRLHREDGPAILCRDGWPVYSWHGVMVPAKVIVQPAQISIKEIQDEQNAEVRRVMLERYGFSRYLTDAGAKLIHSDEMGKLHRIEINNDEPLVMVELLNSTPEQDGTFKTYFLRVPPDMTMARQAVAWTFGLSVEEYTKNLLQQT